MLNPFLQKKEEMAIDFLRTMERPEGYYLAFSGGKDSVVIKHLAEKAGVKFRAVYRVTSVDPPELVQFIKEKHPDVEREIPHDEEGNPMFGGYEIRIDESVKAIQRMHTILGDVAVGGNVVEHQGFVYYSTGVSAG